MSKKLTDEELAKISGGVDKDMPGVPVKKREDDDDGGSGPTTQTPDADAPGSDPTTFGQN